MIGFYHTGFNCAFFDVRGIPFMCKLLVIPARTTLSNFWNKMTAGRVVVLKISTIWIETKVTSPFLKIILVQPVPMHHLHRYPIILVFSFGEFYVKIRHLDYRS